MDMLQPPAPTAVDAAAATISLLVYLAVAIAAFVQAPRDARTRTFLIVGLTSAVAFAVSPLQWWNGTAGYSALVITVTAAAFATGAVALFHFTQVFPRRRPWITAHVRWLIAAYLLPVPVANVAWIVASLLTPLSDPGAGGLGAVSAGIAESFVLLVMVPLLFAVGLLLPFSGVMSLFKSWQEARKAGDEAGRVTTFWMLVSQMAGGVLAVLVLPLLHVIGVAERVALTFAILTYAFGVLMPLTFAVAVWRYRMLSTSA